MKYEVVMKLIFACEKGCLLFWPSYVIMGTKYDFQSTISSACGNHLALALVRLVCSMELRNVLLSSGNIDTATGFLLSIRICLG